MAILLEGLKTDGRIELYGSCRDQPVFSWLINTEQAGISQSQCQVQVGLASGDFEPADSLLWDSGEVEFIRPFGFAYSGPALEALTRYWWRVRIDCHGHGWTDWSAPTWFVTSLLDKDLWQAQWIEADQPSRGEKKRPGVHYRHDFTLPANESITDAKLLVTCHGIYTACINGKRVSDDWLRPGFTAYQDRLQFQVYDVTRLLNPGPNAMGALVTDGWYRGLLV